VRVGRPRRPRSLERRFWEQVPSFSSWEEAGAAVGVSGQVVRRVVGESGGVKPRLREPSRGLSYRERCRIEDLLDAGWTQAEIARDLGRHRSTISREVSRHARVRDGRYVADNAQSRADENARRPKPARLATNLALRREVQNQLKHNHSPEQISARLREDFPDDPEMWVSPEAMYQAIYVQGRGSLRRELHQCLRTKRAVRRSQHQPGTRRGRIPDMINISERPAEVADRAIPGHWEGDLILGSTASGSAIGTLVERSTRFVMLLYLPHDHTAESVQDAIVAKITELPEHLRRSLTWDQGSEMANHRAIAAATDLDIYFCDPHSPWQRGSNENTNGLLRQYFPKGTDLSVYSEHYLDYVAAELNGRPRHTLNWKTPAEALNELLSKPPAVA
jgi:IS30 family transposase